MAPESRPRPSPPSHPMCQGCTSSANQESQAVPQTSLRPGNLEHPNWLVESPMGEDVGWTGQEGAGG